MKSQQREQFISGTKLISTPSEMIFKNSVQLLYLDSYSADSDINELWSVFRQKIKDMMCMVPSKS